LTVAATPSIRFSRFSTRAAQDAQVMPPTTSSMWLVAAGSGLVARVAFVVVLLGAFTVGPLDLFLKLYPTPLGYNRGSARGEW
jgi:hypothetical protein